MKTTQNRLSVLAICLRSAARQLIDVTVPDPRTANSSIYRSDAINSIEDIAEELEQAATAPDPAEVARG
jgi:hypothetical protein